MKKNNWLIVLGWALIIAGFAVRLAHYSVLNIPYSGYLITASGIGVLQFNHLEKQENIDNENT
jgi:hypothetical protein